MYNVISGGQYAGKTAAEIGRQIQASYNVSKSHARFIARDQMAKLNARITQQQQTDAGITEYVWRTVGDGRVRESHRHLNGKRFKYSDPPVVDPKTGRRANPGEDYGWVNAADVAALDKIKVGSTVMLRKGAKDYNGGRLASFVYTRPHIVSELKGDRAVITFGGVVVAAVKTSDLTLA